MATSKLPKAECLEIPKTPLPLGGFSAISLPEASLAIRLTKPTPLHKLREDYSATQLPLAVFLEIRVPPNPPLGFLEVIRIHKPPNSLFLPGFLGEELQAILAPDCLGELPNNLLHKGSLVIPRLGRLLRCLEPLPLDPLRLALCSEVVRHSQVEVCSEIRNLRISSQVQACLETQLVPLEACLEIRPVIQEDCSGDKLPVLVVACLEDPLPIQGDCLGDSLLGVCLGDRILGVCKGMPAIQVILNINYGIF